MAYTFGAGTGDDITWGAGLSMGVSDSATLVTGWWRPTTLTATRGLWSAGNVLGAEIDSTTDELRLRTDNTTDGQWTTSGVDMAINNWYFLAFLVSCQNTTGGAWRVWRATPDTPPVEVTVSVATARVGNFTGNATFYIGNKGTGTVAFQGQAANVAVISQSVGASRLPLGVAAYGTITQAEADEVLRRFVVPHWQGDYSRYVVNGANTGDTFWLNELNVGAAVQGWRTQSFTTNYPTVTVNGATFTQEGPPRVARLLAPPHICCTGL